jgi:hypothetical protein
MLSSLGWEPLTGARMADIGPLVMPRQCTVPGEHRPSGTLLRLLRQQSAPGVAVGFFRWHTTEEPDESRPNPTVGLKPPKLGDKLVPVFTSEESAALAMPSSRRHVGARLGH